MKKRGFGKGRWNGTGGKPKEKENIKQTAVRETREEIGVTALELKRVGVLDFYFPHEKSFDQRVIVYFCSKWTGRARETEEMKPAWFKNNKLPFDKMWPDDPLWLPHVIAGKFVRASFTFGEKDYVLDYKIRIN